MTSLWIAVAVLVVLGSVLAVSEAARVFLVREKGYPSDKIVVVPNGRDLSIFRPGAARA